MTLTINNLRYSKLTKFLQTDFTKLTIWYFLAHGPILLLGNAIYWDDWVIYQFPNEDILELFRQTGSFLNYVGYIHVLMSYMGPFFYKICTFVLILFSGVLVYGLLEKRLNLSKNIAFLATLIYLITPLYSARVAMIDFIYTLSIFLFFLGWRLFYSNKLLAIICFIFSFNTQSLLLWYFVPLALIYKPKIISGNIKSSNPKVSMGWTIIFIIAPFAWFFIKNKFFTPYGFYEGYNQNYNINNIYISIKSQVNDFIYFYKYISHPILLFLLLFFAFSLEYWYKKSYFDKKISFSLIIIGLIVNIIGLFPYWVLGHVPTFYDWGSRHQLLMPFGVSLIIVGIYGLTRYKVFFISLILSVSMAFNFQNYYNFHSDWQKQIRLISFLRHSTLIESSDVVVFDDQSKNANNRYYRFYEWCGLLNQAYPNNRAKFGVPLDQWTLYKNGGFDSQFSRFYFTRNHVRNSKERVVLVKITGRRSSHGFEVMTFD